MPALSSFLSLLLLPTPNQVLFSAPVPSLSPSLSPPSPSFEWLRLISSTGRPFRVHLHHQLGQQEELIGGPECALVALISPLFFHYYVRRDPQHISKQTHTHNCFFSFRPKRRQRATSRARRRRSVAFDLHCERMSDSFEWVCFAFFGSSNFGDGVVETVLRRSLVFCFGEIWG